MPNIYDVEVGDTLTPEQIRRAAGGTSSTASGSISKASLQYPLDISEYKAQVIFSTFEEKYTDELAKDALQFDIEGKRKEIASLERQIDEIKSELDTEEKTQAQYNEEIRALESQIRELKKQINDWSGSGKGSEKKATIQSTAGQVSLYLPLGLAFRDNVTYENFDLGNVGAAMEGGLGFATSMMKGVGSFVAGITGSSGTDLAKLAGIQLASKMGSFGAEAQAAQRLVGGVTLNPNSRVLFKQPNIREFSFTFKFVAKSAKEANEVNQIIKFFRQELYPEDITIEVGGAAPISLGYKFPNKFNIAFQYNGSPIPGLAKIQPCFLRDVSTTFNSSQMAMHSDGNFMEVEMTLSFQETRALTKKDVVEGY